MTSPKCTALSLAQWALPIKAALILAFVVLCTAIPSVAQQSENEKAVWKLESSYWEYVKAVDLDHYRDLWHPSFVVGDPRVLRYEAVLASNPLLNLPIGGSVMLGVGHGKVD